MRIQRINATAQLSTSAVPTRTQVTGNLTIGGQSAGNSFNITEYFSYARRVRIFSSGAAGTIDIASTTIGGSVTYVPAVAQSSMIMADGAVTTNGTIIISVTSALFTSLPSNTRSVTVNLTGFPSALTWAATVRTALRNTADINNNFDVGGDGTLDIILTRKIDDYGVLNDATFNIALALGTALGPTDVPYSTSLAVGSLASGVVWDELDPVDAEGEDLPAFESFTSGALITCARGEGVVFDDATSPTTVYMKANGISLISNNTGVNQGFDTTVNILCTAPPFDVTLILANKIIP